MEESDFNKRRHEVAQVYAGMAEGELRRLAEDAWTLTEIGREALKVELMRRGLAVALAESPPEELEQNDFVTVRRCWDLPEADLTRSVLESAGIQCFLRDYNVIGINWAWSNALGGVKVCVRKEDADAAAQLLGPEIPEAFNVEGVGEYKQPRCPHCQSLDIYVRDLDRLAGPNLGVPASVDRPGRCWTCRSCGHEWPHDDAS